MFVVAAIAALLTVAALWWGIHPRAVTHVVEKPPQPPACLAARTPIPPPSPPPLRSSIRLDEPVEVSQTYSSPQPSIGDMFGTGIPGGIDMDYTTPW